MARVKNLLISIATILFQIALTIGLLLLVEYLRLPEPFKAAAAAIALMIALGTASIVKANLLSRILSERVSNWRWALVWATAPAVIVGFLATLLPEWLELLAGIPAILFVYGWVIWRRGFGPEDRVLFRKNVAPSAEGSSPPVVCSRPGG